MEFTLDIILLERLYCAPYRELNDPFEGIFFSELAIRFRGANTFFLPQKVARSIEDIQGDTTTHRVCSLSETLSDVQMWSHYAVNHKGIAIEIDFTKHMRDLKKIEYLNELPIHSAGTLLSPGSTPVDVLSSKTIHWEHEKEWRIIQNDSFYDISGRITAVYLGPRTDKNFSLIRKIVPPTIPVFATQVNPHSLEVKKKA